MARDTSWTAVLDPGKATDFFANDGVRPPFAGDNAAWSRNNAWWCSEISRISYRRTERPDFLQAAGLVEEQRFVADSTEAALLTTLRDNGNRRAVLVFRGTTNLRDWWTNLRVAPTAWQSSGLVHRGFAHALAKVWPQALAAVEALCLPTMVTGHSLGGALATLACSLHPFVATYTFGAPRVGDADFWQTLRGPLFRVVNDRDVVPTLPPRSMGYQHGGTLHHIANNGVVLREPSEADLSTAEASLVARNWLAPPEPLSDHAPSNYSALLLAE